MSYVKGTIAALTSTSLVLVILIVVLRLRGAVMAATERDRSGVAAILRGEAAAAAGARGDLIAGHGRRLTDDAAARAAHQVDVDVIVVILVRSRREHSGELLACRALD